MTDIKSSNLARYIPTYVLCQVASDPTPISEPTIERFSAAVLFADITGFSNMTERLAARGPEGAEQISRHLNTYMGRIIDIVLEHGGDVMKFAGDALIAVYPSQSAALGNPVRLAAQASLKIQDELGSYEADKDIVFSLRVCVGAGPVALMHLGGVLERWESLISGTPFAQIRSLRPHTEPTEVLLSAEAWDSTNGLLEGRSAPAARAR